VVRVVICCQQDLPQNGLAIAPGNLREEVCFRIANQILQSFQIAEHLFHAFIPGFGGRRGFGFRPVAFGPLGRFVLLVAAEFEYVPLGDADVFEEHPGGVREIGGLGAAEVRRETLDDVFEFGMGVASAEEFEEMFTERVMGVFLRGHGIPFERGRLG